MGIQAAPEVKFAIIREATRRDDNLLKISTMCQIAGVSRSGYYNWCASEDARQARENADRRDFDLILEAYRFRGYDKGVRGIHMRLLHQPGIIMNVKKIRRLMRKFGLRCQIRKANPYRRMAKAIATSNVAPNVVNRRFRQAPRKVLLTDITYLFFKNGRGYLSTILDAFTHEVLAYQVSLSLKVDFVLDTVNQLIREYGCSLDDKTIIHSDQLRLYPEAEGCRVRPVHVPPRQLLGQRPAGELLWPHEGRDRWSHRRVRYFRGRPRPGR